MIIEVNITLHDHPLISSYRAYRKQFEYKKCDDLSCRKAFLCSFMEGPFKSCDLTDEESVMLRQHRLAADSNC